MSADWSGSLLAEPSSATELPSATVYGPPALAVGGELTEMTANRLRDIFRSGQTPRAEYQARKCNACSLLEQCRPKAGGRSARAWRDRTLEALLERTEAS